MSMLSRQSPDLLPDPVRKNIPAADLLRSAPKASSAAFLAASCRLITDLMPAADGLKSRALAGALARATPGRSGKEGKTKG